MRGEEAVASNLQAEVVQAYAQKRRVFSAALRFLIRAKNSVHLPRNG
jgi:hypothetical protein